MIASYTNKGKPLTLGILGGGQLAKMLAQSAYSLGINVSIIENHSLSPAGDMTKQDFTNGWENEEELEKFIDSCDIVTLENEFIDPKYLEKIEEKRTVFPNSKTMRLVQDKLIQKQTFQKADIPLPKFVDMPDADSCIKFASEVGFPVVIKARKYGYDGYGNATVFNEAEVRSAFDSFQKQKIKRPLFVEQFVDFTKEIAVMVARNKGGETVCYPTVETVQYRHICHEVIAPAEIDEQIRKEAQRLALKCVEAIDGIGIFGVEMFLTKNNEVLVNEIAPRPHNSGHYTIEACYTSQFENCIRAVLDLPLGSADMILPGAAMINLLGSREGSGVPSDITELLMHRKTWLHLYNKKQSRMGRKMGHVTAIANTPKEAKDKAKSAAEAIVW
jgi:5-(carboxyamino)imidazole ribonucleotide synthase